MDMLLRYCAERIKTVVVIITTILLFLIHPIFISFGSVAASSESEADTSGDCWNLLVRKLQFKSKETKNTIIKSLETEQKEILQSGLEEQKLESYFLMIQKLLDSDSLDINQISALEVWDSIHLTSIQNDHRKSLLQTLTKKKAERVNLLLSLLLRDSKDHPQSAGCLRDVVSFPSSSMQSQFFLDCEATFEELSVFVQKQSSKQRKQPFTSDLNLAYYVMKGLTQFEEKVQFIKFFESLLKLYRNNIISDWRKEIQSAQDTELHPLKKLILRQFHRFDQAVTANKSNQFLKVIADITDQAEKYGPKDFHLTEHQNEDFNHEFNPDEIKDFDPTLGSSAVEDDHEKADLNFLEARVFYKTLLREWRTLQEQAMILYQKSGMDDSVLKESKAKHLLLNSAFGIYLLIEDSQELRNLFGITETRERDPLTRKYMSIYTEESPSKIDPKSQTIAKDVMSAAFHWLKFLSSKKLKDPSQETNTSNMIEQAKALLNEYHLQVMTEVYQVDNEVVDESREKIVQEKLVAFKSSRVDMSIGVKAIVNNDAKELRKFLRTLKRRNIDLKAAGDLYEVAKKIQASTNIDESIFTVLGEFGLVPK